LHTTCHSRGSRLSSSWHASATPPPHQHEEEQGGVQAHVVSSWHRAIPSSRGTSGSNSGISAVPHPPSGHTSGSAAAATPVAAGQQRPQQGTSGRGSSCGGSVTGNQGAEAAGHPHGFVGYPRACVVAPETHTEDGFAGTTREFVVYKIRVTDASGEWTVTQR
jgi:hypothetical protein